MDSYLRFQRKRKQKILKTSIVLLIGLSVYVGAVYISIPILHTIFTTRITIYGLLFIPLFIGITAAVAHASYTTLRDINTFHISGYYNKRIGDKEIETWLNGESIYKKMREIDEICVREGVTKLTEFGFYDDRDGDTVIWHDANEGLLTLRAVKNHFITKKNSDEKLLAEISRLEYALSIAKERDIQFSLILWPVNSSTNAMEWEARKGTCW